MTVKFVHIAAVQDIEYDEENDSTLFAVLFALDTQGRVWRHTDFEGWAELPGPTEELVE